MKTKVLYISHCYPIPYDELYGIVVHNQAKGVTLQGCDIRVITPIPWTFFVLKFMNQKWKGYSKVPRYRALDGMKVFYPRCIIFPKAFFTSYLGKNTYYGIRKIVRKIWQTFQFDIIHAHMAYPDGFAGMLLSDEYKKPLVTTLQGSDLDITAQRSKRCFDNIQLVLKRSDKVISPSPRLKQKASNLMGIDSSVIGYGMFLEDIFVGKTNLQKEYEGDIVLLSASRLLTAKGIDLNIRALQILKSKYKHLKYIVLGDGPQRSQLEQLTKELNLNNCVAFLGHQPHDRVMEYMSICDIFTMPSWQETFGLVYIEAMAHGKPVIGCKGQGIDGMIIEGENGLLADPRNVNSLVEIIDFLLSNPEKAKEIGEKGKRLVLENYTWERNFEKTIDIYREVLK